jgi:hypothetical protein
MPVATRLMRLLAIALTIGAATISAVAQADESHLYDKWQLSGSGTVVLIGGDVRIDSKNGEVGTTLDAKDDLGLPGSKFQPRAALRWRPGRRHELEGGYQLARRSGETTLSRTIEFEDSTYDAGLNIKSKFNTDQLFLTYRYAFMAKEREQIGAALGLGAFFYKFEIKATGSVSGGGGSATADRTASLVGPTASLGLYGRFRAGEHWYFEPEIRYLRIEIDRYSARVSEGGLAARRFVSPKVAIEAGYGWSGVKVDVGPKTDGSIINLDASGGIKFTQQNLRLGVVVRI